MKIIQLYGEMGDTLAIVTTTDELTSNQVAFREVSASEISEILKHESDTFKHSLCLLLALAEARY
jgi:hypothetical protein